MSYKHSKAQVTLIIDPDGEEKESSDIPSDTEDSEDVYSCWRMGRRLVSSLVLLMCGVKMNIKLEEYLSDSG